MIQDLIGNTSRRRDRFYIMAEILEITLDGALKTQVMYKANLSFAQVNTYLALLLNLNLIETVKSTGKTAYKTTRKGMRYLHRYREIRELLQKEQERNPKNCDSTVFLVNRGPSVICREGPPEKETSIQ